MKISLRNTTYFLLYVFITTTLIIPVAVFNKIVFVLLLSLLAFNFIKDGKLLTISPILIFFIFFYGFVLSFINACDRSLSIQFLMAVALLFLIYLIDQYKIDLDEMMKISGIVLSIFTIIAFYLVTLGLHSAFGKIFFDIFNKYSSGAMGFRKFSDSMTFSFHIGTVPFLYLPFSLYINSFFQRKTFRKFLAIILITIPILLSASRGLIIMCLVSFVLLYFYNLKTIGKIVFIWLSVPIVLFIFYYLLENTLIFSFSEVSNSTKRGHLISFFDNITFTNIFTGNGLATYYFSQGVNRMTAHTEITPIDMLRYFGVILTPILYLVIIFPTRNFKSYLGDNSIITLIFILYLVFSFTNPIMFNSFGLLIVLWYWSKIVSIDEKNKEDKLVMLKG